MKPRVFIGVAVAACIVGVFLWLRPGSETYLVPKGYTGPVVVFFSHPQGTAAEGRWGSRVYRIPPSGVLLLKDAMPDGQQAMNWAFIGPDGKRTPLAMEDDAHADLSVSEPRVRMFQTHTLDGVPYRWVQAQIGRPNDRDSFGTPAHFVVDPILEELSKGP